MSESVFTICFDCNEKHDLEILKEWDHGEGHTMVKTRCTGCGATTTQAGQDIKAILHALGTSTPVRKEVDAPPV
jgi:hypothetical protein